MTLYCIDKIKVSWFGLALLSWVVNNGTQEIENAILKSLSAG